MKSKLISQLLIDGWLSYVLLSYIIDGIFSIGYQNLSVKFATLSLNISMMNRANSLSQISLK